MTEPTKRCCRCGEVKELEYFYRASKSRDGHHWMCITCCRAYSKTPEQRAAGRARNQRKRVARRQALQSSKDLHEACHRQIATAEHVGSEAYHRVAERLMCALDESRANGDWRLAAAVADIAAVAEARCLALVPVDRPRTRAIVAESLATLENHALEYAAKIAEY